MLGFSPECLFLDFATCFCLGSKQFPPFTPCLCFSSTSLPVPLSLLFLPYFLPFLSSKWTLKFSFQLRAERTSQHGAPLVPGWPSQDECPSPNPCPCGERAADRPELPDPAVGEPLREGPASSSSLGESAVAMLLVTVDDTRRHWGRLIHNTWAIR